MGQWERIKSPKATSKTIISVLKKTSNLSLVLECLYHPKADSTVFQYAQKKWQHIPEIQNTIEKHKTLITGEKQW